jgi:hypothetical protein
VAANKNDMDDVEDGLQNNFAQTFGWFIVVNKISENDITKHNIIYKMNVVEVLNQLSYVIAYEQEQVKAQNKLNGQV